MKHLNIETKIYFKFLYIISNFIYRYIFSSIATFKIYEQSQIFKTSNRGFVRKNYEEACLEK